MKKLICVLLIACMIVPLAACAADGNGETTTAEGLTTTEPEINDPGIRIAVKDGEVFFKFVRPEKCGQILRNAGTLLVQSVADFSNSKVDYSDDWYLEETEIKANEVLIGDTNRPESKAHTEKLNANDWYIRVVDGKIVINGGSESAVAVAVKYFIETYIDGKEEIVIPSKLDKLYISDTKTVDILSVIDKVKVIGRSEQTESGITCDWTASGIEFTAECEGEVSVGVSVKKAASSYSGDCYYTVYVDGERSSQRLEAKVGDNELTLASGLEKGVHTFRLLKQSHIAHANSEIKSISLKGTIGKRPENKELYFEFIGDSITCGYGLAGEYVPSKTNEAAGNAYYCDGTKTYAFLASEALGADYSMVSVSGWLLSWSSGYGNSIPRTYYPYYNQIRGKTPYDFKARIPNAVIINLGTNDYSKSTAATNPVKAADFKKDLMTFVGEIREYYGKADLPVVFITNAMNNGFQTQVNEGVAELGGESAGVYVLKTTLNREGMGNHPNCAAQEATGKELASLLKAKGIVK